MNIASVYGVDWPVDRRGRVLAAARAALGPSITGIIGTDFETANWYAAATGAAPLATAAERTGGWVEVATTAVAGNIAQCVPLVSLAQTAEWQVFPKINKWEASFYGAIASAAGADSVMMFDLRGAGGGVSPAYRIGSSGSQAGGTAHFSAEIYDDAGANVYDHNTGVAFDQLAHLWTIRNDGTTTTFFIDGVQVGSFAVATALDKGVRQQLTTYNGTSSVVRSLICDYMYLCFVGDGT